MSGRFVRVECEAEVDVIEALEDLDEKARLEALEVLQARHPSDVSHQELARRLARAIEVGDGKAAADCAHQLCMDLAGAAVMREIHIGRAPWERAA